MSKIKITSLDGSTLEIESSASNTCQYVIDQIKDLPKFKNEVIILCFDQKELQNTDIIDVDKITDDNPLVAVLNSELSEKLLNLDNAFDYLEYPFSQFSYETIKYGKSKAYKDKKAQQTPYHPIEKDTNFSNYDEHVDFIGKYEEEEQPEVELIDNLRLPTILTDIQAPSLVFKKRKKPKRVKISTEDEIPTLVSVVNENARVVRRQELQNDADAEVVNAEQNPQANEQDAQNNENDNNNDNQINAEVAQNQEVVEPHTDNQQNTENANDENENQQNTENANDENENQQNTDNQVNQNENQEEQNDDDIFNIDDILNIDENPQPKTDTNPKPSENDTGELPDDLGNALEIVERYFSYNETIDTEPNHNNIFPNKEIMEMPFTQVLEKIREAKRNKTKMSKPLAFIAKLLEDVKKVPATDNAFTDEISRISRLLGVAEEISFEDEDDNEFGMPNVKITPETLESINANAQEMEEEEVNEEFTQMKFGRVRRMNLLRQDVEAIRNKEYDEFTIGLNENYTNEERHQLTNLSKIGFDFSFIVNKYEENGRDFDKTMKALIKLL